jgi:hypothetical protein
MPCSKCTRRALVERPDADQWGPLLWTLLHGVSLKRSAQLDNLKLNTLKVKWKLLFETLPNIIPCVECKEHITNYIAANPFSLIKTEDDFSNWFYLLHEDVNSRLGKPSFDYKDLNTTYKSINLRTVYYKYDKLMELFIQEGDIGLLAWGKMKTVLLFLYSFYNL